MSVNYHATAIYGFIVDEDKFIKWWTAQDFEDAFEDLGLYEALDSLTDSNGLYAVSFGSEGYGGDYAYALGIRETHIDIDLEYSKPPFRRAPRRFKYNADLLEYSYLFGTDPGETAWHFGGRIS